MLNLIIITNCFFDWMGIDIGGDTFGPCYLNNNNEHRNILVTGNIATNVHGTAGGPPSGDNLGIMYVLPAGLYFGDGVVGFVEIGNVSDDQY